MTILSFKPKGRGGGCGAPERHIVFKLKAQLLFPRQVCLPPPRARGRQPSDGIVIHQGPVTAAQGLTPPSPGTARLGSALRPAKVTPPRQLLLPRAPQHPPLLSPLLSPPVSFGPHILALITLLFSFLCSCPSFLCAWARSLTGPSLKEAHLQPGQIKIKTPRVIA